MLLREYLETAPDDKTLYIGARVGFLLGGLKKDIHHHIEEFDEKAANKVAGRRMHFQIVYDGNVIKFGEDSKDAKRAKKTLDAIHDHIPLLDREVIETFNRTSEQAVNIIVEGDDEGKLWSVKEDTPIELEYNVDALVAAILKGIVDDYKKVFDDELKTFAELENKLAEYRAQSARWEKYFRGKDFKYLTAIDPEYMIDEARRITIDELFDLETKARNGEKLPKKRGAKKKNEIPDM